MRIVQSLLMIFLFVLGTQSAVANQCTLPPKTIKGPQADAQYEAIKGFVLENMVGLAQDKYAERVISQFVKISGKSDDFLTILTFDAAGGATKVANNYVHVLKALTIAKAVSAGEIEPIKDWVVDEAVGASANHFAKYIGATSNGFLVGMVITALKTVKESYDTLEHEDCLLNLDMGYYQYMKDPALHLDQKGQSNQAAVDRFIHDYIPGGGTAPYGTNRAGNRRILQCYINLEMPEDQRIILSHEGAKEAVGAQSSFSRFMEIFEQIGDVSGSAADAAPVSKRLRTPVIVMLRDFNARYKIEQQTKELNRLMRTDEYKEMLAMVEAMKTTAKTADWLCARLASSKTDIVGNWSGMLKLSKPTYKGKPFVPQVLLDLDVAENGDVQGFLYVDPRAKKEGIPITDGHMDTDELHFTAKYSYEENGRWINLFKLSFSGEMDANGTLQGKMGGTTIDIDCAIRDDDDNKSIPQRNCRHVPADGRWELTHQ